MIGNLKLHPFATFLIIMLLFFLERAVETKKQQTQREQNKADQNIRSYHCTKNLNSFLEKSIS